jgi:hypothetical protein
VNDHGDDVILFFYPMTHMLSYLAILALPVQSSSSNYFSGSYSDPNHPSCARQIVEIASSGKVYGSDAIGGEGYPCNGLNDTKWGPLPASINQASIIVDFSSKGGPSNLHGEYNQKRQAIDWEDGNSWSKISITSGSIFDGMYADPNHPICERTILSTTSESGNVMGSDAARGEGYACDGVTDLPWGPLPAKITGSDIIVDFSSKGGPANLHGTYDTSYGGIKWEDGNVWTKIVR